MKARCPLCGKAVPTFRWPLERRIYQHHCTDRRAAILSDPDVCEASGWLVEDDELIDPPRARKVRSDAGKAR